MDLLIGMEPIVDARVVRIGTKGQVRIQVVECRSATLQDHVGGSKGPSLIHLMDAGNILECIGETQMVAECQKAAGQVGE